MSTAEKIFEMAQGLPEPTRVALLQIVELLASDSKLTPPKPQFGSARGQIKLGPEFDEPWEDFKPYMQ